MHMMRGEEIMKCLEIKNGKGYFLQSSGDMRPVDEMKKEDLLYLLDLATSDDEEFEMDDAQQNRIENQAHKIIYNNLKDKFEELLVNKKRFLDESENLYKEALQKYQV